MSKNIFKNHQVNLLDIGHNISLLALSASFLFQSNLIFAATEDGRWHAGIGDPTIFGWITVLAYTVAVMRCSFNASSSKKLGENYFFWLYLAMFLFLLGINKQLDLQSWFTQTMKDSAQAHGWYEHRRPMQTMFIALLGFGMLTALVSLRIFLTNSWRKYKLALVGIVLLCTFILMRAASFHHFDLFINNGIVGIKTNVLLEIGAILLIILAPRRCRNS